MELNIILHIDLMEDGEISVKEDGTVTYYNTFNLTNYDATDTLKVHLFKTTGEEVVIELEKEE